MGRCLVRFPGIGSLVGGLAYKEVYIVPAILGSIGILIIAIDCMKTCAALCIGEKKAA